MGIVPLYGSGQIRERLNKQKQYLGMEAFSKIQPDGYLVRLDKKETVCQFKSSIGHFGWITFQ